MENIKFKTEEWRSIIFSDEKKFNLDGPDGWAYYWHDIRTEEKLFSKRQMGGEYVMVWSSFSYYRQGSMVFLDGRINAAKYCSVLQDHLLPLAALTHGETWTFQHDNAPIHTARLTKRFFIDKNIECLTWPTRSPDLNPIENLWSVFARKVYANSRQFASKEELKMAIAECWRDLHEETLQVLSDSMPRRIKDVIRAHGGCSKY